MALVAPTAVITEDYRCAREQSRLTLSPHGTSMERNVSIHTVPDIQIAKTTVVEEAVEDRRTRMLFLEETAHEDGNGSRLCAKKLRAHV